MTVRAIAVDASDNVYLAGSGDAGDFPGLDRGFDGTPDGFDAFVAKLDRNGGVVWSTFVGGRDGFVPGGRGGFSIPDSANAIAVDAAGQVFIAGSTASDNFPTVAAFQTSRLGRFDGFVAKLSADGRRLLYSSYIGAIGDSISAVGIAAGPAGEAWIHALSPERRWIATSDVSDGDGQSVVLKLGPSGGPVWSTRVPISTVGGFAVDGAGRAHAIGARCTLLTCDQYVLLRLDTSGSRLQYQTMIRDRNANVYRPSLALLPNGRTAFSGVAFDAPTLRDLQPQPCTIHSCGHAYLAVANDAGQIDVATYLGLGEAVPTLSADSFGRITVAVNTRAVGLPVVRPLVDHHVDGPIYVSRDRGTTFRVESRTTLPSSAVRDLAFNPLRRSLDAVFTGIYESRDEARTWRLDTDCGTGIAECFRIAADPRQTGVRYGIFGDHVFRHDEGASAWRQVYRSAQGTYQRTIVVSPHDSSVWIAGNAGVATSVNGGSTWSDRSGGLPNLRGSSPTVEHLAFDPQLPGVVYALTQLGLYRTRDDGITWEDLYSSVMPFPYVRALAFDPISGDTLHLATLNHGMLKSVDAGRTWVRTLEGSRLWAAQTDPLKRHIVYAAGSDAEGHVAFFRSIDRGATWHRAGEGLDMRFEPSRLVVDPVDSMRLYLGSSNLQSVPYLMRLSPDAANPARFTTEFATYLAHGHVRALAATLSGGVIAALGYSWPESIQEQAAAVRIAP